jgi:hypothetical protein
VYIDGTQPPQLVTQVTTSTTNMALVAPGRMTIALTDLSFPALFSALSFTLTTATQTLQTFALNGASSGTWYYDVATPDTLSGIVFARPDAVAGFGMYNLDVRYSYEETAPVPLPAGLLPLLAALGGMLGLGRVHRRSRSQA